MVHRGSFDVLTPERILAAIEACYAVELDGVVEPYASYVNRVFGVRQTDGRELVAKFYRPDRWSLGAIDQEHAFLAACVAADVPVAEPIADGDGVTLQVVAFDEDDEETEIALALFPKRGGRTFDADRDDDWRRLGAIAGRIHTAGASVDADERQVCTPDDSAQRSIAVIESADVVHPDVADEFFAVAAEGLERAAAEFAHVRLTTVHGDLHRANILDRGAEGLMVIDFDDMMRGPAMQDLWLLLPDRLPEARRELDLILSGYEQFAPFDDREVRLVEPLRFMRMLYYLAWAARQRDDNAFLERNPDWGSRAFWVTETEALRTQLRYVAGDEEDADE